MCAELQRRAIESAAELPSRHVDVAAFARTRLERHGLSPDGLSPDAPATGEPAVRLRADTNLRPLVIAEEHLAAVVDNLVENALRHSGGAPVEVELREAGGRLLVEVRDRGPGISEANQKKIGTRFFTTERDRGGTGLGLSIVQAIARARGGDMRFESSSEGTTFVVAL
jgi:two-component system sensor histidine kinase ChvG